MHLTRWLVRLSRPVVLAIFIFLLCGLLAAKRRGLLTTIGYLHTKPGNRLIVLAHSTESMVMKELSTRLACSFSTCDVPNASTECREVDDRGETVAVFDDVSGQPHGWTLTGEPNMNERGVPLGAYLHSAGNEFSYLFSGEVCRTIALAKASLTRESRNKAVRNVMFR